MPWLTSRSGLPTRSASTAWIFEKAGSEAIATTSAGIAFACGYPDGQTISRARMLETVARICAAVSVPVTADMEAGYGDTPEEMHRTAVGVLEAGAVGLNLEDGTGLPEAPLADLAFHVEKIRAVLAAGRRHGVPIVLNARTDVYLARVGPEAGRLAEAIRRGEAYRAAGADCVFVPGVTNPAVIGALVKRLACPVNEGTDYRRVGHARYEHAIGALVKRLACPVNVLAVAGSPSIAELARLGVARELRNRG